MSLPASAAPLPHLKIRPVRGWATLGVREIWDFRDLIWTLAGRDLKLRYRQTALGAVWVVIQPLIAAGIFAFVFGQVARLPSSNFPYFLFAFAGLLCWQVFSQVLTKTSGSLIGSSQLVSKVYFPRLCLPLSTFFSGLVDFAIGLVVMGILLVVYQVNPGVNLLLLPLWLALALMLALGAGSLASALTVSYRDVNYVVPVMIQFLLFASPVAYSLEVVRDRAPAGLEFLFHLNPLASLLEAFRWSLLGRGEMHLGWLIYSGCACVAAFFAGTLIFRRMEQKFADVI